MLIQTALVTSGLVCMNQSLAGSPVDNGYGIIIGLFGYLTITRLDGIDDFLDGCAHV